MEANFKATTNIISPNEEWYFKQSLFSYWISSSHNTYLPYDQILGRSSICYYRLQLMFYYGGCVEIDTYGVTDKGDAYAIVCDGCSSSPDVDFGARIMAKARPKKCNKLGPSHFFSLLPVVVRGVRKKERNI
jgi:hypothetical protein